MAEENHEPKHWNQLGFFVVLNPISLETLASWGWLIVKTMISTIFEAFTLTAWSFRRRTWNSTFLTCKQRTSSSPCPWAALVCASFLKIILPLEKNICISQWNLRYKILRTNDAWDRVVWLKWASFLCVKSAFSYYNLLSHPLQFLGIKQTVHEN